TARELWMKASSYLEQGAYSTLEPRAAFGRLRDSRQELEQGALARSVMPNDPHRLTRRNREGNITQRPQLLFLRSCTECPKRLTKAVTRRIFPKHIPLSETDYFDCR